MSKLALSSSLNMEAKLPQKQGIVSILTSDCARSVASLRRTLSADMSSKKWLSQNGVVSGPPLKKIASSKELSQCISEYSSSTDGDEEDQVKEKPAELQDIWSLIVSQSKHEQDKSAAPYIHPLLKRSASALSKQSLEVCTESLGSETGSDDFSPRPPSQIPGKEEEQQPQQQQQSCVYEDVKVVKYNFAAVGKKLPPPAFPPPLPSLPARRMKPRRENGRLVLEAVSMSEQSNIKAERQDGRLVLTFVNEEEAEKGVVDQKCDDFETEAEIMMEQESNMSRGLVKLHRLALMMNKSTSLAAMNNPTCPNHMVKVKEEETLPLVGAAYINAYEYCWRAKPTAAQAMEKSNKYVISKSNSSIIADKDQHLREMVMMKGIKADYNLKGCKDHTRSLFREPYCIATS